MAVAVSSLSVAIQGVADFLDGKFGEDVSISVDSPHRANDRVKSSTKHLLNLFVYRIVPSGFHADTTSDEASFVRLSALITPFVMDGPDIPLDTDLRVLGQVIRVLNSHPVVPGVLPGAAPGNGDDFRTGPHHDYRLQAVMQTPTMEELNHIWTTQGGDLAYRLSAAYEFSLVPIEPMKHRSAPTPVTTGILDISPNVEKLRKAGVEGFIPYGEEALAKPTGGVGPDNPPSPIRWLPVLLLVDGGVMSNVRTVEEGTTSLDVAIAGAPSEKVALEVAWTRANGTEDTQSPQVVSVATHRIDHPAAVQSVNLTEAKAGDKAIILTRPVDAANQPLATSPFANTLTLTVEASS